jgi:hypothetical protein
VYSPSKRMIKIRVMNPPILSNGHNNSEQVHFSLQKTFWPKEFSATLCRNFRSCRNGYVGSNRKGSGRKIWSPVICTLLTFIAFQITINCSTFNADRKKNKIYPLTPNDHYSGLTVPLTFKRYILCIYSTNIGTEYFKHGIYSPCFSLQNAVFFIILTIWFLYYSHFIYRVC